MEECIKVNTKTTRNMVTESTLGQMVVAMKDTGLEVNSTVWELTSFQKMEKSSSVSGKMESVLNGLTKDK